LRPDLLEIFEQETLLSQIDRASAAHTVAVVNFRVEVHAEEAYGTSVVAAAAGSINFNVG